MFGRTENQEFIVYARAVNIISSKKVAMKITQILFKAVEEIIACAAGGIDTVAGGDPCTQ
jgi:hypothetical protein